MINLAPSDFDFYLKFTKPLVLALPSPQDRALAASWIKKLINTSASQELKNKYLKVLLLGLQKKRLSGIFAQHPQAVDITEENLAMPSICKDRSAQYTYDFSADLLQYVAVQEVKDFGVHAFFATSNSAIGTWHNVDKLILPQPVKEFESNLMGPPTIEAITKSTSEERMELNKKKHKFAKSIIKSVQQPPSSPIGKLPGEDGANKWDETWQRPSWGSNLIQVDEIIQRQ